MSSLLVEAGAGSGKTAFLMERLQRALVSGQYRPEQVAAVTFTRRAAGELAHRLRQALQPRFLEGLFVGTVHGLCAQILRRFPVEAQLSPTFREMSEEEQESWMRECLSRAWERPHGQELFEKLELLDLDTKELWPSLRCICQNEAYRFPVRPNDPQLYQEILGFLLEVRQDYARLRRERGLVNFHDLIERTLKLVERSRPDPKIRLLVVDEFQDTDESQARLFFAVADNLLLVGDPKQSIYRFRGADLAVYQRLKKDWAGERLALEKNYRATPELCAWLNEAFSQLFPDRSNLWQTSYTPQRPVRPSRGQPPLYRFRSEDRQQEAQAIAGYILHCVGRQSHNWSDFLVLTARNAEADRLRSLLESWGIPCDGVPQRKPLETRAASLLPLLRHLVDPQDKAVLAGVLRGPLFGHSDEDLYLHVRRAGTLRPFAAENGLASVTESLAKLNGWRTEIRWLPPGAAMARLMELTGAWMLAQAEGPASLAQLRGLLECMRQNGLAGMNLAQAVNEVMSRGALQLSPSIDSESVRILNVHKAKGLQARVVFLAAANAGFSQKITQVIDGQGQGFCRLEHHRRLLAQPADWEDLCRQEKAVAEQEHLRLLYVAATRARETLIVGVAERGRGQRPWKALEPFLGHCPHLPDYPISQTEQPSVVSEQVRGQPRLQPTWKRGKVAEGRGRQKPVLPALVPGLDARDWGHLLHSLLEQKVAHPELDLESWGHWYCREHPKLLAALPHALSLIWDLGVLGDWQRQALEQKTEVPFGIRQGSYLLFGTFDLVLRRKNGWGLIDYKSDRQQLSEMMRNSARQIGRYAECWKALTQQELRYAGVYSLPERKLSPDLQLSGERNEE